MSNTRKQQPEKISADCPHCGYSQLESAYAKSTICKRCSQHFSIEKLLAKEVGSLKPPSVFEKLTKMIAREGVRDISCFSCAATQQVSTSAESSLCPKCGSYIDLRDFRISGPFGRTVQTQGRVTILPKGEVTTRILCGHGRIEGKMRGVMISSGVIEIKLEGRLSGQVEAVKVVVERRAEVEFSRPVKARTIEIDGRVSGELFCDGKVTINKHGSVSGSIHARAIEVEKGGIFSGELHIGDPAAAMAMIAEEEKGLAAAEKEEVVDGAASAAEHAATNGETAAEPEPELIPADPPSASGSPEVRRPGAAARSPAKSRRLASR